MSHRPWLEDCQCFNEGMEATFFTTECATYIRAPKIFPKNDFHYPARWQ